MSAASDPKRCVQEPGRYVPEIDPGRCEAKGPCVPACPYGVLALQPLDAGEKGALSWLGRLKARVHGNRRAKAVRPEDCRACGYCVEVCPEKAITLRLRPVAG
jgi:NAD-dependent dihydropyrimidine dehydrogenase PreA subunit